MDRDSWSPVIVTLLDPLLDEVTADRVVPRLAAGEAKAVAAATLHRLGLHVLEDSTCHRQETFNDSLLTYVALVTIRHVS